MQSLDKVYAIDMRIVLIRFVVVMLMWTDAIHSYSSGLHHWLGQSQDRVRAVTLKAMVTKGEPHISVKSMHHFWNLK